MYRSRIAGLLLALIGAVSVTHAADLAVCKPALAFKEVRFSAMQPPTLERKWAAVVSVDASRCAANSEGQFEIGFSRLKEMGDEIEFRQRFRWLPRSVEVAVDFWADEAVQRYWIDDVTPWPCAG
jgi:hypothetical protein